MASVNPLRYRGYYYDTETGFYYLQSRYYDPANHRFINADVYASTDSTDAISYNMFAYCGNNLVMRQDESGDNWLSAIVGAAVGGIVGAISAAVTGGDVTDIVIGAVSGAAAGAVIGATGSVEAGKKAGKFIGSAFSAAGTYISTKRNGGTTTDALILAGTSFATTYLVASIPTGGDLLTDAMVSGTIGAGPSLCINAIGAGITKKRREQNAAASVHSETAQQPRHNNLHQPFLMQY